MLWLKVCPRCRGDLIAESDLHGRYVSCLQCGYILKPAQEVRLLTKIVLVAGEQKEAMAAA